MFRSKLASGRNSPAVELKSAIAQGRPVRRGHGESATQGHGWGEDRQLPADVLYDLLTGPGSPVTPRAAVLVGLRITGRLNLEAAELQVPLIAHSCFFDKPINLIGASAPAIRLKACVLPGIDAAELKTRYGFDLSDSRLEIVDLIAAHVGGPVDLSGATLTGGRHPLDLGDGTLQPSESAPRTTRFGALYADGLEVDQDLFCCEGERGQRFTADGEVSLVGAHIGGTLDFDGARLTNAEGPALDASGLEVDQGMFCRRGEGGQRFTADGEVRLLGAHIGGTLEFDGAHLTAARRLIDGCMRHNGPALNAERLEVDQSMFCRQREGGQRFTADGEVRLLGAHIGGQLNLGGAQLTNRDGRALDAARLRVDQGTVCAPVKGQEPFTATSEVRLVGAHIGGQLNLGGAQLTNRDGRALTADRLQVDGDVFCQVHGGKPFTATGEVRLRGAHITGQLGFNGAQVSGHPTAIDLYEATVGSLWLRFGDRPNGVLDLRRVQASVMYDRTYGEHGSWPKARLDGCRYESLEASPPVDVESRLRWVRDDPGSYSPQPYEHLRDVLRRAGHEEDARRVAIAKQRRRRQELPLPAKAWSYILDAGVGYGYRTWRALAALLAIIGIGWLVFAWASWDHHLTAIKAQPPPFEPWMYSIDAVLPVINLGQESAWAPTGLFFEIWYVFSVVAGWLLGLGLIAALTAALFRE